MCAPTILDKHIVYHDTEWCVPRFDDDRVMFEFLTLEGAQCGLSWTTVLRKRDAYTKAFKNWDIHAVAEMVRRATSRILSFTSGGCSAHQAATLYTLAGHRRCMSGGWYPDILVLSRVHDVWTNRFLPLTGQKRRAQFCTYGLKKAG